MVPFGYGHEYVYPVLDLHPRTLLFQNALQSQPPAPLHACEISRSISHTSFRPSSFGGEGKRKCREGPSIKSFLEYKRRMRNPARTRYWWLELRKSIRERVYALGSSDSNNAVERNDSDIPSLPTYRKVLRIPCQKEVSRDISSRVMSPMKRGSTSIRSVRLKDLNESERRMATHVI